MRKQTKEEIAKIEAEEAELRVAARKLIARGYDLHDIEELVQQTFAEEAKP